MNTTQLHMLITTKSVESKKQYTHCFDLTHQQYVWVKKMLSNLLCVTDHLQKIPIITLLP